MWWRVNWRMSAFQGRLQMISIILKVKYWQLLSIWVKFYPTQTARLWPKVLYSKQITVASPDDALCQPNSRSFPQARKSKTSSIYLSGKRKDCTDRQFARKRSENGGKWALLPVRWKSQKLVDFVSCFLRATPRKKGRFIAGCGWWQINAYIVSDWRKTGAGCKRRVMGLQSIEIKSTLDRDRWG